MQSIPLLLHRLLDRGCDLFFVTNIERYRQGAPACALDLFGNGVDRTRQFRVRLDRFGSDYDIGPVGGRFQRDGCADTAARAGNK